MTMMVPGYRRGTYKVNKYKRPKQYVKFFLAIMGPAELRAITRDATRSLVSEARNLRFSDLEKLHMNLQFLGSTISKSSLHYIVDALTQLNGEIRSPQILVDRINFGFPHQNISRILHWDAQPNQDLQNFTSLIHQSIKELNLEEVKSEKDYKKVIYHFTIARAKHKVSRSFGRKMDALLAKVKFEPISFYPEKFFLIKSTIKLNGVNTYEVLASFDFAPKSQV